MVLQFVITKAASQLTDDNGTAWQSARQQCRNDHRHECLLNVVYVSVLLELI